MCARVVVVQVWLHRADRAIGRGNNRIVAPHSWTPPVQFEERVDIRPIGSKTHNAAKVGLCLNHETYWGGLEMEVWARGPVYSVESEQCLIVTRRMVKKSTKSCSMDRNIFDFIGDLQI